MPAGSAQAAHRPSLPSATCPTTCLRKPCANTEGSPAAKPKSSLQQKPQWENKGCNFTPAERKCVFLQLILRVWSSPPRVRCQAGAQPGTAPLSPLSRGGRETVTGPALSRTKIHARGRKSPTPGSNRISQGPQVSAEHPARKSPIRPQKCAEPGSGSARRPDAARSPHFWCARPPACRPVPPGPRGTGLPRGPPRQAPCRPGPARRPPAPRPGVPAAAPPGGALSPGRLVRYPAERAPSEQRRPAGP